MNENNVVKYNENGEEIKPLETDLVGTYKPHILNESELLENNLTLNDYFTYCSLNDAIDIDFFLDLLPHEAMHTFGFKGGIFEGITESFTRQIAQKYNLRFIPLAHPDETSLFQKVEKIIGRKNLSSCLYNPDKKGENIELLSDLVDDKTCDDSKSKDVFKQFSDSDENLFDAYKNKKSKNEIDKLANKRLECEEKLNDVLGKYISTYPNNLYTLGQALNISTYDESKYALLHKKEVVAIQEDEIEKLEAIINKLDRNEFRASLTTQNNSENEYDFAKADTHQDKSR